MTYRYNGQRAGYGEPQGQSQPATMLIPNAAGAIRVVEGVRVTNFRLDTVSQAIGKVQQRQIAFVAPEHAAVVRAAVTAG